MSGFHQVEHIYPDQTITDNFRIVRRLNSSEDEEGNCYDWYEIDRHYRTVDRTGPLAEQMSQRATEMEDVMCEMDAITDERLTAVETALCELDEAINA